MQHSGPRSYYDEYVRRKGTSKITLHDPPSLLTDRGAYVNFLEVQLERVSAACLGVQAYDQRFNDMQNLIVHLEDRIASTTRLLALSQQCSEVSYTIFRLSILIYMIICTNPKEFQSETQRKLESMESRFQNSHRATAEVIDGIRIKARQSENSANEMQER